MLPPSLLPILTGNILMSAYSGETTAEFVRLYWTENDETPKHEKLSRALSTAIAQGFWAPGARLPSEAEFTAATPCSLGTVQRALRRLADDGVIERRRRSGTVVADFNRALSQPWHMRFFDDAEPSGKPLQVFTKALSRSIVREKGRWSKALDQRRRPLVRIDRIFFINGKLKVYSIVYTLVESFPALATLPLSELDGTNFKLLIAHRYVMPVHRVRQSLRIEKPTAAIAKAADLKPGAPVSVMNFVAYNLAGEAMYYQDFYIPPSRYRLDLGTNLNTGT